MLPLDEFRKRHNRASTLDDLQYNAARREALLKDTWFWRGYVTGSLLTSALAYGALYLLK